MKNLFHNYDSKLINDKIRPRLEVFEYDFVCRMNCKITLINRKTNVIASTKKISLYMSYIFY